MLKSSFGRSPGCWTRTSTAPGTCEFSPPDARDLAVFALVPAHDLEIEGRRQTEVDRLADDVGGQEIKRHPREIPREHETGGRLM